MVLHYWSDVTWIIFKTVVSNAKKKMYEITRYTSSFYKMNEKNT